MLSMDPTRSSPPRKRFPYGLERASANMNLRCDLGSMSRKVRLSYLID